MTKTYTKEPVSGSANLLIYFAKGSDIELIFREVNAMYSEQCFKEFFKM